MIRSNEIALAVALVVVLSAGCVSTPVSAPSDGRIMMGASPPNIVLNEFATPPVTTGSTLVSAQIFDMNDNPFPGAEVMFSSDGGSLTSNPPGEPATMVTADDNGFVSDTLTVQIGDPSPIEVTVRSGLLFGSVTVTTQETAANQPPDPDIDIRPAGQAMLDEIVFFDATDTDDPDGDPITCFQWEIETGENIMNPMHLPCSFPSMRCEVEQGPLASIITRTYSTQQVLLATLRVTDDPAVLCPPGGPTEPASSFNAIAASPYEIVCDPTPPVALGGPDQMVALGGGVSVLVALDGSNSTDFESGIPSDGYNWNCGNGTAPINLPVATCLYTEARTFFARLTVTNNCGQVDTDDVRVFVGP